jgi:hypothetical protein
VAKEYRDSNASATTKHFGVGFVVIFVFLDFIIEVRCREFGELTVDLYEMANTTRKLCVCVVWVRYERLRAYFKDLQTTLGSATILAFSNFDVPFIILW